MIDIIESWFFIAFMYVLGTVTGGVLLYKEGKEDIIEHCKTYSAFKISEEEAMLCVVKPLLKQGEGDLNYMRPEGKQIIKPKYKEI